MFEELFRPFWVDVLGLMKAFLLMGLIWGIFWWALNSSEFKENGESQGRVNHEVKCKECGKDSEHNYCDTCDIERRLKGLKYRIDFDLYLVIEWLFSQFKEI